MTTNRQPERPFDEPWQAKVFALTVHLHDLGHFSWGEWTDAFAVRRLSVDAAADGADYYDDWAATLEEILVDTGVTDTATVDALRDAWNQAAHDTPHGQPIELSAASRTLLPSSTVEP